VVTIGSFDGVHLGHRALVEQLKRRAGGSAATVVVTFDPHPRAVLAPDHAPKLLTLLPEKTERLAALGVEHVVVIPFDEAFAQKSPREFMAWLEDRMHVEAVVCGYDFAFGHKRLGSANWLRQQGYDVVEVPPVEFAGQVVRSSAIRALLGSGEVAAAAERLGRRYSVRGAVVKGHQRGRELGFPTANVDVDPIKQTPSPAAYAGLAEGSFGSRMAAISVGHQPTFGGTDLAVEAYLLDFEGDLYGQEVEVEFAARLHPDTRYPSVTELIEQITRDVAETRRLLSDQPR
jgi:riboflavin kinase/FMN adenylyltransferase